MNVYLLVGICAFSLGIAMGEPNSYSDYPTPVDFRNRNSTVKRLYFTFETFSPQGLKVSISNAEGIDLFAFGAKINLPIRRSDTGSLTWEKRRPIDDTLVKDFPDIELQHGDIINYWARIQYNGVSLHAENLKHIVKELSPGSFDSPQSRPQPEPQPRPRPQSHTSTPSRRPATESTNTYSPSDTSPPLLNVHKTSTYVPNQSQDCVCNEETLKDVWTQLNATAAKMRDLEEKISPLEDQISSLTETVQELIKNQNVGRRLLLTGNLPVRTNPVEDVRHLLIEKLKLQDLSTSILQANYTSNGILFEVSSSIDKLRILKRSADILSTLSYKIIDPDKHLDKPLDKPDDLIDIRMDD